MSLDPEVLDLLRAVANGEITNNGCWYRNGVALPSGDHIRLRHMTGDLIEIQVQTTAYLPVRLTAAGEAALRAGAR